MIGAAEMALEAVAAERGEPRERPTRTEGLACLAG